MKMITRFAAPVAALVCFSVSAMECKDIPLAGNWNFAFQETGRFGLSSVYGAISARTAGRVVSQKTLAAAKAADVEVSVSLKDGSVSLRRLSTLKSIGSADFEEPVTSVEYFSDSPESGFLVLVGWARIHYYSYHDGRLQKSDEISFRETDPSWKIEGVREIAMKVATEDRNEISLSDQNGRKSYYELRSKALKNLLEQLHVTDASQLPAVQVQTHLPNLRWNLLELELELRQMDRPGQPDPTSLERLLDRAASSVADLQNPDFADFFPPFVEEALRSAFTGPAASRFLPNFAGQVEIWSNGRVKAKGSARDEAPFDGYEPVLRFESGGRSFILYYSSSARRITLRKQR